MDRPTRIVTWAILALIVIVIIAGEVFGFAGKAPADEEYAPSGICWQAGCE